MDLFELQVLLNVGLYEDFIRRTKKIKREIYLALIDEHFRDAITMETCGHGESHLVYNLSDKNVAILIAEFDDEIKSRICQNCRYWIYFDEFKLLNIDFRNYLEQHNFAKCRELLFNKQYMNMYIAAICNYLLLNTAASAKCILLLYENEKELLLQLILSNKRRKWPTNIFRCFCLLLPSTNRLSEKYDNFRYILLWRHNTLDKQTLNCLYNYSNELALFPFVGNWPMYCFKGRPYYLSLFDYWRHEKKNILLRRVFWRYICKSRYLVLLVCLLGVDLAWLILNML